MKKNIFGILTACVVLTVLQTSVAAQPGLQTGQKAPDFIAKSYTGAKVSLSSALDDGPVVLVFYRGAWCPYCNLHLKQLQDSLETFEEQGATLIAISVDKADKAAETVAKGHLEFEVITDSQADILKAYGVVYQVPEDMAKKYKESYSIDLEGHSGRTDHIIAQAATYVINQEGIIVFAYANEDYKVRAQPEAILEALKSL